MPKPTPLTTPNDIGIQSAILPQYTFRTDRPTDGIGEKPVPRVFMLESDTKNGAL